MELASEQARKEAKRKKKLKVKAKNKEGGLCRYCLEVSLTPKALAKHVAGRHSDFYVRGGSHGNYFAQEGQKVPDDPKL